MPAPSPGKRRGAAVRQLSLQEGTDPPRAALKKQFSEDDGRGLDPVAGRTWAPVPILRIGSGDKIGQKAAGTRPKPVKVAWADRKTDNDDGPAGVEVIATKCQGQPRPATVKAQRLRSPLLGSKDTLVYTRLQLEERLRNAWSERAKMKPNINIFLARGAEAGEPASERCVREAPAAPDAASALSDSAAPLDKKRKSTQVRAFFHEFCPPDFAAKAEPSPNAPEPGELEGSREDSEKSSPRSEDAGEGAGRRLQELNKIEIRMTKEIKDPSLEPPSGVKRCRNKETTGTKSSPEREETENKEPVAGAVTAQDRRANFRRSSAMHRTITESFSREEKGGEEPERKPPTPQRKPPLTRAASAPSQTLEPSDPKAANPQKKPLIVPQKRFQATASFDLPGSGGEDAAALRERIKSAPVRRRLKSAAVRRKTRDKESSDEEKEPKDARKTNRRSRGKSGGDIVTMVSLVSPAGSDTEDSLVSLPVEPWTGDDKEGTPRSADPPGAPDAPGVQPQFLLNKFVSLRKAPKSVTFQQQPLFGRGYSASFPSRRAPAGTPLVVPTPVVSHPALTPAQIVERDRRASLFSAISLGADRGVKRRLLRSASESPKDEASSEEKPPGGERAAGKAQEAEDGQPELRCPKERECWHLYQKMVEKGVSVSFDTVLRGMLTPTEYRLRKNRLLSNC